MALQNRVAPDGEIVDVAARGLLMGNRGGALHDERRRLGRRRWVSRQWISCKLEFNNRHRTVMAPGRYTELFFLDEATAMAAGHRPCFECRRADAMRFAQLWAEIGGGVDGATGRAHDQRARAPDMDVVLQRERVTRGGRKVTYTRDLDGLPDGVFVRIDGQAHLVFGGRLLAWSHEGYAAPRMPKRRGPVEVLTPTSMVGVLAAGYRPMLHPTAIAASGS